MARIDLAKEATVQHALDTLHKAGVHSRYGNYIGGRWIPPLHGRYFTSHSPINTEPLCDFATCIRAEESAVSELDEDTIAYHFKEPMGVVGQIIPWNFPLLMAAWKL